MSYRSRPSNNADNSSSSNSSQQHITSSSSVDIHSSGGAGGSTFALSQPVQLSHPLRPASQLAKIGLGSSHSSSSNATPPPSTYAHTLGSSMASAIHPGSAVAFQAVGGSSSSSSPAPGQGTGHGPVDAMGMPNTFAYTHRRNETAPAHFDFGSEHHALGAPRTGSGSGSGPLRIHQVFPDAGEPGVPVTILVSVRANWAKDVGLWLADGRYGGSATGINNRATSQLVVSFGSVDAETRAEKSMGASAESPISSFTPLHPASSSLGGSDRSSPSKDLDLTIVAHTPPYPTQATSARVPLRLRLVGPHVDPMVEALSVGVDLGIFHYWHVSPRSSLKRQAEDSGTEPALRRPASFPALNASGGAVGGGSAGGRIPPQPSLGPRSQTYGRAGGSAGALGLQHQRMGSQTSGPREASSSSSAFGSAGGDFTFSAPGYDQERRDSWTPMPLAARPSTATSSSTMAMFSPSPANAQPQETFPGASSSAPAAASGHRLAGSTPPQLVRASQVPHPAGNVSSFFMLPEGPSGSDNTTTPMAEEASGAHTRATLAVEGDLNDMAIGWSEEEYRNGRRLVQFWRRQTGNVIQAAFQPVRAQEYQPNTIAVSCIFRADKNECFITSVDTIYLLEALVESRFTVEEKNRIRRNLEGLRPITISKGKRETEEFFKLIMSFPDPKPRHIEKDIKVFPWRVLGSALHKIISKYRAVYSNPGPTTGGYPAPPPSAPAQQAAGAYSHQWHQQQQHQQQQQQQQQQQHASMMGRGVPAMLSRHEHSDSSDSSKSLPTPPTMLDSRLPVEMHQQYHHHQQHQQMQPPAHHPPHHFSAMPQQQRQLPHPHASSAMGLDVGSGPSSAPPATNSSGAPLMGPFSQEQQQQQPQHQSHQHYSNSLQQSPSNRRNATAGGGGGGGGGGLNPSSFNFNFSDFVVSPVAFGHTPLQQAQAQAMQQQQAQSGQQQQHQQQHQQQQQQQQQQDAGAGADLGNSNAGGGGGSLGVELGEARGSQSYRM